MFDKLGDWLIDRFDKEAKAWKFTGRKLVELEKRIEKLELHAVEQANAPVHRGQLVDPVIEEASENCLSELTRYAWRNEGPVYEDQALQIIQRFLSAFAATPPSPNGK